MLTRPRPAVVWTAGFDPALTHPKAGLVWYSGCTASIARQAMLASLRGGETDGFIGPQFVQQPLIHVDEVELLIGRCNAWKAFRLPIVKPQPGQELEATGMRVTQTVMSRDMCPDLDR